MKPTDLVYNVCVCRYARYDPTFLSDFGLWHALEVLTNRLIVYARLTIRIDLISFGT